MTDPGETKDLSLEQPARYQEMLGDYARYEQEMGVLKLPDDFNPHTQVKINAIKKQLEHFRVALAALAVGLLLLIALLWRRRKPRR